MDLELDVCFIFVIRIKVKFFRFIVIISDFIEEYILNF